MNKPNPYSKLKLFKTKHQLKNQRNQGKKHEIFSENKKTHTFFLKIEVEMMSNNGGLCEKHGGFKGGINGEDNEQSQKFEGKLKGFKNCP